ncbi:MAG TPA: hypothetical protein VMW24_14295 [Sedimentisphaerales bacterium]|nr:hypothetical protein [Sedimentisphaerales bacterium]
MIAMVNRKWPVRRRLAVLWLWSALALGAPANEDGGRSHTMRLNRLAGGNFEIGNPLLSVRIDSNMRVTPSLRTQTGTESLIIDGGSGGQLRPQQYVKVAGSPVTSFSKDAGHFDALEPIETVHGRGKRFRVWATAERYRGGKLRKTVTIDLYERYPQAVLFQTRYANVGDAPVHVETYYEASLRLDGSDLWAFHPRNWIWGEDFLFPVKPELELEGSNIVVSEREADYRILGGGLPAVCFISPRMTLTLGYISPKMKMLRFPVRADSNGVSVGMERDIGLGPEKAELAPGDTLETVATFIALHQGDFYEGVRVMSRLHEDIGLTFRDPPIADLTAPAWSNRGNRNAWDKQYILEHLPLLRQYGIKWIHMGDPWQDNLGDYGISERFSDPEDLRRFLTHLRGEGFHVTAFFSDLLVDCESRVVEEHPEYLVRLEDGSLLRVQSFGKSHYVLCPAYPPAREFVRWASEKLAGYYGFDGVKNDGHTVPLPCFNPAHKHQYPEQSVEDYPLMQKTVYETFARLKPEGFVVAFCFDGVVPFFYHHHYTTRPWPNADQASEKQARWKQKLYKAIFGPNRVLLDDHSDVKYLSGRHGTWYLGPVSGLAMGSVLETAIGPGYDYKSRHYDDIFAAYHREKLPEGGEYLNLYNVIHDKPECHVVRKDSKLYFGFFADKFDGTLELRGLKEGVRYRVVDYVHGREYPDVNAVGSTARLNLRFDSCLLLRLDVVP